MYNLSQTHIEQILGNPDTRYFASGFRYFINEITHFQVCPDSIKGEVEFEYSGPSRPRDEKVHLGSIELTALSLTLSTFALNRLGKINKEDTERAFIRKQILHISNSLYVGRQSFECTLIKTTRDFNSLQGYVSLMEVNFNKLVKIQLEIDHRGYSSYKQLPINEIIPLELVQLYSLGYKSTEIDFYPAHIDLEAKTILAEIKYTHLFDENAYTGVGSARNNLLTTDAIRVFGQLMQTLLYTLENTNRETCNNIWLRKLALSKERPEYNKKIKSYVKFDDIRQLTIKDKNWELINLHGQVGNYAGQFQVAYQK